MPSILITGANRGLGFEFARQYGADGWRVIATCRHPIAAAALQELVARAGVVRIIPLDVTNLESVRQAATQIEEPIDIVINSAGIGGKRDQKTGNVDYEFWREVLNVNTMGPLRVTEAFVDHLARSERKLVVTITSGMGSITDNTSGGFELIFIGLYIQAVLIGDFTRSLWPLICIVLTLIPFVFELKDKIILPYGLKMTVPFALFLHVAGGIMRWYWEVPFFDKLTHVVSAIAFGLIIVHDVPVPRLSGI